MDDSSVRILQALPSLTPRERECLLGAAAGETAKEIGRRLNIGHRTVQNYQQEAARKLGVRGTIRAARLLIEADQSAPVDVHPAPKKVDAPAAIDVLMDPSEPHGPPAFDSHENPQVSPVEPVPEAVSVGRIVRMSALRVLLIILAWGVGFSMILMAVTYLYVTWLR